LSVFPVSWAQQRLWLLEQIEDTGSAYTLRLAVRLRGLLDIAALERALDALVARHESLRTRIATRDGEPVQLVSPCVSVPLERRSVEGDAALRAAITAVSRQRFELAAGPLVRFVLIDAAADDHVLVLLMHHAIGDAWSSGVLFRDLAELYAADIEGRESALPELTVQYADYAVWQREWLTGAALERQLAWWREALAGAPPLIDLPTDRPRPPVQSWQGSRWTHILPRDAVRRIHEFAVAEGATPFMVLFTAFALLLRRHAGQDDLVIGTPVAGRRRTELEPVAGFFANTLPLRARIDGNEGFRAALAAVRATALAAWDHQDLPFERLVEALRPPRSLAHAPVFQVMFILQNSPWEAGRMPGIVVEPAETDAPDAAKFDLTLSATEYAGELWLGFEYATALFDADTVATLARRYAALIDAALAAPAMPVDELPFGEEARVITAAQDLPSPQPSATVHGLVLAAGQRDPDAMAIECGNASWRYRDLLDWSSMLADRLRLAGAGRGSVVGLCLERSPEMVAALLAVLRAGAAYLPLDPAFPPARLAFMLEDSGCSLLVTSRRLLDRHAAFAGRVLCIEDLQPLHCALAPAGEAAVSGDDGAYLLYTSGSTGTPKGVPVRHGSVVNFLRSMLHEPGIGSGDRWLAVTTLSFDIAVLELLGPLAAGATVVLASAGEARDPAALARLIAACAPTVMQATPSTWRALVSAGWRGCPPLRILSGGEALDATLARALAERGAALWNLYGPTETTVWSTVARLDAADTPHIGRPVANTSLACLDAAGRPLPAGIVGELAIAGAGVAAGYWRRPELTAERFIEVPQLGRAYRSGDRARFRRDGRVELLGRNDGQVKLRGFRIELGEVEAVLAAQPGVAAAAAAIRAPAPGDERLCAWVVAPRLDAAVLSEALRRMLPDYMLPAAIVPVDALPLTPNGKIDRGALPMPQWGEATGHVAPRDAIEEALCRALQDVLAIDAPVGIHADFFALGGHSLAAARFVARVEAMLGRALPLRSVFERPTVAALRALLADVPATAAPAPARSRGTRAPLTWQQRRLWFLEQLEPGTSTWHLHLAWRINGQLDVAALQAALRHAVDRHDSLRTVFRATDGEPEQVILPAMPVVLEQAGIREDALEAELARRVALPFDLERGPLLRATVLQLSGSEAALLVVVHHLVADGWSLSVLLGDLAAAYAALRRGESPDLSPLPTRYADVAHQQRAAGSGGEALRWWCAHLAGAPPAIALPVDHPRPVRQRHRGARLGMHVPPETTGRLRQLARAEGATLFMAVFAAFQALLARWSGDEDLVVGIPHAGRPRPEHEPLVGFFVNTLALRGDLRGNPRFSEILQRTKAVTLDAWSRGDVPLEQIVETLSPVRDPARTPLFQVLFNFHNEPVQAFAPDGLAVSRIGVVRATAKYELSVSVIEAAGGLEVGIEYDTDLFDAGTVALLAESYGELLHGVAADAALRLADLPLAGPSWRCRLAAEHERVWPPAWEPAAADPGETLVSAIAARVLEQPDAPAVSDGRHDWSYAELWSRAGAIAVAIRAAARGEPGAVAVDATHDAPMIAAVLGVLRSGGHYAPLDPWAPAARQRELLALPRAPLVAARGGEPPPGPVDGSRPAYRLHTSGTTGRPKAIEQTHAGALAHVRAWGRQLGIGPADRLALVAALGYDAAVQDIFGALVAGAAIEVLDLRGAESGPELVDRIAQSGVTLLHLTPTVYRHLFGGRVTCDQDLSRVRLVVLGGEEARRSDFDLFRLRFGRGARLVNGLGLSESTTALQFFADHDTKILGERLPVGRPVPGSGVRVDGWLGELVFESAVLARYVDPADDSADHGLRTFHSGDQLRRLPDGNWVHAGRRDRQVKLRGIRIEPADIELALRECGCADAVVALACGADGADRLLAWVAPAGAVDEGELRRALRERLPESMIPAEFVPMDALPRRANGKLDRSALDAARASVRARMPEPTDLPPASLEQLAALWCGVLDRQTIGSHEDFFALGGHSLLATRLIARVRDAFDVELPLIALFESPTIAGMAAAIERTRSQALPEGLPALRRQRQSAAGSRSG